MTPVSVLAFDLGAGSGRAIVGRYDGDKLETVEVHRFPNEPVRVGDRLYWDILRLLHEIKAGIRKARQQIFPELQSLAIDTWAVDFGLLDKNGELLGNPHHYRDSLFDGLMEEVGGRIGENRIFASTGIQFLPFNTIYQLAAMKRSGSVALEQADTLLMIPDLLRYFLTGVRKGEFTNASTTQLMNAQSRSWDLPLLAALGLPAKILPEIVESGTMIGGLLPSVCDELGLEKPIRVIAVGEHDTAAAVAAVPADQPHFAYLSCGTWSLLGTELPAPVLTEQAREWNFTNEGGVEGTTRLLKNIMGLWLMQECKRVWEKEGMGCSYEELVERAEQAEPFRSFVDPDDRMFLAPLDMPKELRRYCADTGQPVPETEGQLIRCVLESLALKYRLILERTEILAGRRFGGLHMIGGGIHNELLCRFTANAIGRPVWAGPAEASALGNIAMQLITLGSLPGLQEARAAIRRSFPARTHKPGRTDEWNRAYETFRRVTGC